MDPESPSLAAQFEENRGRLRAVARRMLGSAAEAEDAVQEAWLRLNRPGSEEIANLGGWLTTVTARICLDMLRARNAHPETSIEDAGFELTTSDATDAELLLADSMGPALMLVLDLLPPAERVAFVLHDLFAVPFDEVATILERTPEAARQLASRARRRVQNRPENPAARSDAMRAQTRFHHQRVVDAFLTASREGDFEGLLRVLSPGAVLRADALAVQVAAARAHLGAPRVAPEVRGADFRARSGRPAARSAPLSCSRWRAIKSPASTWSWSRRDSRQ
jgi:RNA polymerase sigma factor (sigma-70 family)